MLRPASSQALMHLLAANDSGGGEGVRSTVAFVACGRPLGCGLDRPGRCGSFGRTSRSPTHDPLERSRYPACVAQRESAREWRASRERHVHCLNVISVDVASRLEMAHIERVGVVVFIRYREIVRPHRVPYDGIRAHLCPSSNEPPTVRGSRLLSFALSG